MGSSFYQISLFLALSRSSLTAQNCRLQNKEAEEEEEEEKVIEIQDLVGGCLNEFVGARRGIRGDAEPMRKRQHETKN